MLDGLVAMRIVAHIHNLHFTNFVYHEAIIAVVKHRWQGKHRVQHTCKGFLAIHQMNESLHVMKHRPGVMPAVSFRKRISPLEWIEWSLECSVFILSAHQLMRSIVQVLVVHATLAI